MKSKIIMVGLIFLLALSLLACSPSSKSVSVEVSGDDFMIQNNISQQVEVAAGGSLTVILGSNPTTGFQWSEEAQISDTGVLKQVSHEFISPDSKTPPVAGASGKERWTFKALKSGIVAISMAYNRPWEGGEKGVWTYALTVTVK